MVDKSYETSNGAKRKLRDMGDGSEAEVMSGPAPDSVYMGQIAMTGSAVAMPAQVLQNGVVITANENNSGNIFVGGSNVNTMDNGTGTGYRLVPGQSISSACSNANIIYLIGPAGSFVYYSGN